ncbi:MAG: peptide deformylase [Actinomycetota bacterium]
MSVQPIRIIGDPVLRTPAAPVTTFDKELRVLVRDLDETMRDAPGVGLAAPQIGIGLRVFTYATSEEDSGHIVNPVLADLSDEQEEDEEGCLSVPGLTYPTKRGISVVAKGFNMHGEPIVIAAGNPLLARCLQHETDHLDGVVFIDRLEEAIRKRAMREIREQLWDPQAAGLEPVIKVSPHELFGKAF